MKNFSEKLNCIASDTNNYLRKGKFSQVLANNGEPLKISINGYDNELKVYKINKVGSISKKVKKEINTELKFLKYIPCINSKW